MDIGLNLKNTQKIIFFSMLLVAAIIIIQNLWLSDDSAITFRTVLNFVNGNGAVYNIGERTQNYTHPLWFLLLSVFYLIVGNIFYTAFLLSLLCSLGAIVISSNIFNNYFKKIFFIIIIIFSPAFIDYSSSGLENPLTYLISSILVFLCIKDKESILKIYLMFSLLYLTRIDNIFLFLPLIVYLSGINLKTKKFKTFITELILGMLPILVWHIIALIYYGFLFPNTFYAKVFTGIPKTEIIFQGILYIFDLINFDMFTSIIIALGIYIGFLHKNYVYKMLSLGILLQILYIVWIGGDFMRARFFAYPFLISAILICSLKITNLKISYLFYILLLTIGIYSILKYQNYHNQISAKIQNPNIPQEWISSSGICDEKMFYFAKTSFILSNRNTFKQNFNYQINNKSFFINDVFVMPALVGFNSLYYGPHGFFIDTTAITDPLLSKLQAQQNPNWRIGHLDRTIPQGYIESIKKGQNLITHPEVKALYDKIFIITKGPIFSIQRFEAIISLNLKLLTFKPLIKEYY